MFNFLYVLDIDECLNSDSFCADTLHVLILLVDMTVPVNWAT